MLTTTWQHVYGFRLSVCSWWHTTNQLRAPQGPTELLCPVMAWTLLCYGLFSLFVYIIPLDYLMVLIQVVDTTHFSIARHFGYTYAVSVFLLLHVSEGSDHFHFVIVWWLFLHFHCYYIGTFSFCQFAIFIKFADLKCFILNYKYITEWHDFGWKNLILHMIKTYPPNTSQWKLAELTRQGC